jgi:hypothetical protein
MKNCTEAWHTALSTQDPLLFNQLSLKVCTVANSVRVNQLGRVWEDKTKQPWENIDEFWQSWTVTSMRWRVLAGLSGTTRRSPA